MIASFRVTPNKYMCRDITIICLRVHQGGELHVRKQRPVEKSRKPGDCQQVSFYTLWLADITAIYQEASVCSKQLWHGLSIYVMMFGLSSATVWQIKQELDDVLLEGCNNYTSLCGFSVFITFVMVKESWQNSTIQDIPEKQKTTKTNKRITRKFGNLK